MFDTKLKTSLPCYLTWNIDWKIPGRSVSTNTNTNWSWF